jgi:hypothetical protein
MSTVEIHARLANTVLLYTFILALWAFWRYFRREGITSSYWGSLAIAELLILLQGGLGVYLWFASYRPTVPLHILYGVVGALGIPAAFAFTRGRETRREILIYGASLLFLVGIFWRAWATG